MKDWEINKVNALYKELDDLRVENVKLKQDACSERLSALELKLDTIIELLNASPKKTTRATKK